MKIRLTLIKSEQKFGYLKKKKKFEIFPSFFCFFFCGKNYFHYGYGEQPENLCRFDRERNKIFMADLKPILVFSQQLFQCKPFRVKYG